MNEQVRLSRSSSSGTKANSGWAVITTLVDRAACKNVKHALRHGVKYTWNLIHFILALKSHIMRVIYAKTYNVNVLFVHFKLMWELNASSPVTDTWGSNWAFNRAILAMHLTTIDINNHCKGNKRFPNTSWITHAFWLVLTYDLMEDRYINDTSHKWQC